MRLCTCRQFGIEADLFILVVVTSLFYFDVTCWTLLANVSQCLITLCDELCCLAGVLVVAV